MQAFTAQRSADTVDELWLVEHFPVFTLGQAGKKEHVLAAHDIPLVQSDRGGQVTYHGPGQLVAYPLYDLKRLQMNTREFVVFLESALIKALAEYGIEAHGSREAPGVYVNDAKIASIGLRLKNDCTYHGIALNITNDLTPFSYINPCGIAGQKITSLQLLQRSCSVAEFSEVLIPYLSQQQDKS